MHASADSRALRRHPRTVFRLQLGLGAVGLIAATAAVVTAADSVHHDARASHEVVVLGARFTYPAVNVAAGVLLLLAALGAVVLLSALAAGWRQLKGYRSFVARVSVVGPLPGHSDVTVIEGENPQAFCIGYLRPRIYISSGAVDLLSREELGAVLLHEQHHRQSHDPLRLACTRILNQAVFFLPALRPLSDRYGELAEIHADDAAVRGAAGDRGALASALLAFDAGAPSGSAGISPERVDSLLGVSRRTRLPAGLITLSAAAGAALVVLIWRASAVASANATFNLPIVSRNPCMLVFALVLLAAVTARCMLRTSASADLSA